MNPRDAWFVAGFLAGAALGAAGALLFAPASGDDLRAELRHYLRTARQEARQAGLRAEADVLTRYKAIRHAATTGEVALTSGVYHSPAAPVA